MTDWSIGIICGTANGEPKNRSRVVGNNMKRESFGGGEGKLNQIRSEFVRKWKKRFAIYIPFAFPRYETILTMHITRKSHDWLSVIDVIHILFLTRNILSLFCIMLNIKTGSCCCCPYNTHSLLNANEISPLAAHGCGGLDGSWNGMER